MSETILAIFDAADEALSAAAQLKGEGFDRITIMSAEPIPTDESEDEPTRSLIGLFSIGGGLAGAAAAIALTILTSEKVNIITGGMPIVTPWAFGIVVFEMTALGAILATLGRMIYEAGLGRRDGFDGCGPDLANGKIVLAVDCPDAGSRDSACEVLGRFGASLR
jgi:hypothetical protein